MSKHHDSLLFMVLYREALDRLCSVRLNMYLVFNVSLRSQIMACYRPVTVRPVVVPQCLLYKVTPYPVRQVGRRDGLSRASIVGRPASFDYFKNRLIDAKVDCSQLIV